jgi:formate dehydrogenase alpha subunit
MGSHDGRVVEVNPSHRRGTVNQSTLCIRGHFAHDYLHVSERLTDPMIRNGEGLVPVSWDEALEHIATKLSAIKEASGPNSLAFLGSSKCSNEENYLFQKIARVVFQTHNLDNGGYGYGNPVIESCREAYLRGKPATTLSDLEKSEVIFVLGADIPHSAPVIGYALKRAYKERGTPIVLSDPRETELVPFSALWLPVRPQSDVFLINALAALLHSRGAVDHDFIDRFTSGADLLLNGIASLDIQKTSALTGIARGQLERAADLIQGRKTTFIVGNGILQQGNGVQAMQSLFNLILLTGKLGREGSGIIFLTEENNQAGAMDMGVTPDFLPGRVPIGHERGRKQWEDVWGVRLSPDPGLNVIRMVEEAEKGNLRGLYVMGENPLRSLPQPERVKRAFRNLSFLVVQDILETETTRMADVILPAAAFSEKAGAFTNFEGRIQHFRPVVPPPGSALPDWDILNRFYSRMCGSPAAGSLDAIRREITTALPSADRSGGTDHRGWMALLPPHKLFHRKGEGETIAFTPLTAPYEEPEEGDYPVRLIIFSLRCHLGSGTRTSCSERIKAWSPENAVEMSTTDGRRFNLTTGEEARITSPAGSIIRTVRLRERIPTGLAYIPKAVRGHDVMTLIPLRELGKTDSPGWKMCRVKIEKIGS